MAVDYKDSFTDVGELLETEEYGLVVKLTFGKQLRRLVKNLFNKKLEVSFKPVVYNRSLAQNRWLWGVAYPTIVAFHKETTGETIDKEAIHAYVLTELLERKLTTSIMFGKEVIHISGKSTSALNTKEFNELKEKIQQHWAEKGCVIPDPPDKANNYISDYLKDE